MIINLTADPLFNILSICRTEYCNCFELTTLYSGIGFIEVIKSNVGFITVLISTFTLNIEIGVSTNYIYGNTVRRRFSQFSLTKSDKDRERMKPLAMIANPTLV